MNSRYLKRSICGLFAVAFAFAGCLLALPVAQAQEKENLDLNQVPAQVMVGLKAKFPKAVIDKCTEEKEGEIVVYDFEFKQEGHKFEADIKADGSIHNWEKAIKAKALPPAVKKAVQAKYPKSEIQEVMQVTTVIDGKDALEGYEILIETADDKEIELTVAAEGKILEDSGDGSSP